MTVFHIILIQMLVAVAAFQPGPKNNFRPTSLTTATKKSLRATRDDECNTFSSFSWNDDEKVEAFEPMVSIFDNNLRLALGKNVPAMVSAIALASAPGPAHALAGPVPSAFMAWAHYVGLLAVAGGLTSERFLIRRGMTIEEESKMNVADGIYRLGAVGLLISGYFRVTEYAKGWDFYKNEPIFWLKMSSVAVLGGLSFYPTIILFRRDQARRQGQELAPLSDAIIDRMTTILNAELLAFVSIPLMASLMARGVLYYNDFPWAAGVGLYALSLGSAGLKYGQEAFDMMESEGALEEASSK